MISLRSAVAGAAIAGTLTACAPSEPAPTVTVTVTSAPSPDASASPTAPTHVATGHGETPTPIPSTSYSAAEQAGVLFLVTSYSCDTATDDSPQDAATRGAQYATPELAAVLTEPRETRTDASWTELIERGGRYQVTAQLQIIGTETDTESRVVRAYVVTQTPVADGWVGQARSWIMILTLVADRQNDWLVQEVTTTP